MGTGFEGTAALVHEDVCCGREGTYANLHYPSPGKEEKHPKWFLHA